LTLYDLTQTVMLVRKDKHLEVMPWFRLIYYRTRTSKNRNEIPDCVMRMIATMLIDLQEGLKVCD